MRRTAVVALLAALVAAVVMLWPARPTWQVTVGPSQLLGFAPDGSTVYRADTADLPTIVGHDAATGRERSHVALRDLPAELAPRCTLNLSADATRAVAFRASYDSGPRGWSLYDARTGTRLTPFAPQKLWSAWFSPDGRWLCLGGGTFADAFFDATTGTPLPDVPQAADAVAVDFQFRADGAAVAALTTTPGADAQAQRHAVELFALPSGRSIRRFDLPPAGWTYIADWHGDRITVEANAYDGAGPTQRSVVFDTSGAAPRAGTGEPAIAATDYASHQWRPGPDGRGWATVVRRRGRATAFPHPVLAWAGRRNLIDYQPPTGDEQRVRVVDPASGATRSEVPAWVSLDMRLAPDGRRLVELNDDTLRAWPTAAAWPRGAVAMIAAGAVLMFDRRTKRRTATFSRDIPPPPRV